MSVLHEVGNLIAAIGITMPNDAGTPTAVAFGTNMFTGFLPDDPNACIVLYEYPGRAPEGAFGVDGISTEHAAVQVRVRGAVDDYDEAREVIERIYIALGLKYAFSAPAQTVGHTTRYVSLKAGGTPALLQRDEKNRPHFVLSLDAEKEPSRDMLLAPRRERVKAWKKTNETPSSAVLVRTAKSPRRIRKRETQRA